VQLASEVHSPALAARSIRCFQMDIERNAFIAGGERDAGVGGGRVEEIDTPGQECIDVQNAVRQQCCQLGAGQRNDFDHSLSSNPNAMRVSASSNPILSKLMPCALPNKASCGLAALEKVAV
jgi:hypothetical protein